jgi:hypothetical protein
MVERPLMPLKVPGTSADMPIPPLASGAKPSETDLLMALSVMKKLGRLPEAELEHPDYTFSNIKPIDSPKDSMTPEDLKAPATAGDREERLPTPHKDQSRVK